MPRQKYSDEQIITLIEKNPEATNYWIAKNLYMNPSVQTSRRVDAIREKIGIREPESR